MHPISEIAHCAVGPRVYSQTKQEDRFMYIYMHMNQIVLQDNN